MLLRRGRQSRQLRPFPSVCHAIRYSTAVADAVAKTVVATVVTAANAMIAAAVAADTPDAVMIACVPLCLGRMRVRQTAL